MPIYEVNIPGKGTFDVKSARPLSEEEAIQAVMAQLEPPPAPAPVGPEPESGFLPALKSGYSGLKSDVATLLGRTGLMDEAAAEKYRAEQEAYQKKTFKPTEEGWTEAPFTKATELLGGSLPYMAAPVVAGGAAALAPVSAPVAGALGLGAAGLTSAAQFTGSNLSRQIEEGKKLGETDLAAASLAAVPQAALDMLSFKMMPGIRRIFAAAGKEIPEEVAKKIADQSTKEILKDYAVATGKAMGTEGLTEAGQQVLERLQAGLNITDQQARDEYFESFIGGAVLGGTLSPAGRYIERSSTGAKEEREAKAEAARIKKEEAAAAASKEAAAGAQAPLLTGEEAVSGDVLGAFSQFDAAEREEEKNTLAREVQSEYTKLAQQAQALESEAAAAAQRGDGAAAGEAARKLDMVQGAMKDLEARTKKKDGDLFGIQLEKPAPRKAVQDFDADADLETQVREQIGKVKKELVKAGDLGDFKRIQKATEKLDALKEQLAGMKQQGDLFGASNIRPIERAEAELTKAKEEAEAKAKELADKKTLYATLMSMQAVQDERTQKRKTEEEQAAEAAQERATRKLEFGLERMGLTALGYKQEERIAEEAKLNKNMISPRMAKQLGIRGVVKEDVRGLDALDEIEVAYQRSLETQKNNAAKLLEGKEQLFDAKGNLTKFGSQAATDEAVLKTLQRLRSMSTEAKAVLEDQARADKLEQELEARATGAYQVGQSAKNLTKETEAARLRKRIDETDTELEEVLAQIEDKEGKTPEQIQDLELKATELRARLLRYERQYKPLQEQKLALKESALDTFSSAIYDLQRGKFLGTRPSDAKVAEAEAKRNAEQRGKIDAAKKELEKVKARLKTPAVIGDKQLNQNLQRRQSELEADIKKLEAGLSTQPEKARTTFPILQERAKKAITEYVNSAINEVNGTLAAKRLDRPIPERFMSESEERTLRNQLTDYLNEVLGRATAAERVTEGEIIGTTTDEEGNVVELRGKKRVPNQEKAAFEKLRVALNVLKKNLDTTIANAKGEKPEADLPVEKSEAPKKAEVKRTGKALDMIDRIKELETQRERAKPAELPVDILQAEVDKLTEISQLVRDIRRIPMAEREEAGLGPDQLKAIPYVTDPKANAKLLQDLRVLRSALRGAKESQAKQQGVFDTISEEIDALEKKVTDAIENGKKNKPETSGQKLREKIDASLEILFNIKKEVVKLSYSLAAIGGQRARIETKLKERNTREGRAALMKQLKDVKAADAKIRERIDLLKKLDADTAAMLKQFGVQAKADQVVEVSIPNYSGTGSIVVEQPIGLRLEPYGKARGERILSAIEAEDKATEIISNADEVAARLSVVPLVKRSIRYFEGLANQQENMVAKLTKAMNKAKGKEAKDKYAQIIKRVEANLTRTLKQVETNKRALAVAERGATETAKTERAPRFNYDQIQLAKKALDERIKATQARLKALPPIERTFEDVLRDASIGAIKTPTGENLTATIVTTRYERMPRSRDAETVKAEKQKAAEMGAKAQAKAKEAYEKVKNDPNATEKEKTDARMALIRAGKIKNSVKDFEFVDIPVRTKTTKFGFVDGETAANVAQTERYLLEDRLSKKGIPSVKAAEEAFKAAEDTMMAAYSEYNEYVASGNKLKATEAKAAYLNAKKLYEAAYMTKLQIEEKVKQLEGKAEKKARTGRGAKKERAGTSAYLDLDDTLDQDAKDALLSQIQTKDDVDWRIGEEVTEVLDPATVTEYLEGVKQKAAKRGIKFEYYDNFAKTPIGVLRQLTRQGMDMYAHRVRGGVMPDGTVFVIVDHHNDLTDIEATVAHELIGHYTTDSVLGNDGLRELMRRVDKTMATKENESGLENLAAKLGLTDEYNDALASTYMYYKKKLAEGRLTEKEVATIAKIKGLREIIAYTTEARVTKDFMQKAGIWLKELVGAVRKALRAMGLRMDFSTSDLFYLIKESERAFLSGKEIPYVAVDGGISLASGKPKWSTGTDESVIEAVGDIVAPPTSRWERIKANVLGLNFRTQFLDRAAALEEIRRLGLEKGLLNAVQGVDLTYFIRNYDQKMSYVAEAATNGVVQLREVKRDDGLVEYELARDLQKEAASLQKVAAALQNAGYGNAKANGDFFTAYMAAERALVLGTDKAGGKTSEAKYEALRKEGRANEAIQEARKYYNEYNHDLITLLEQSGSLDKKKADELRAKKDYVPYYVPDDKGVVSLMVDGERITRVGSLLEQPELKELVGSDQKIRDFFTTSLQNTHMIMDMALRNLATRNVGFVLQGLGLAKRVSSKASGDRYIHARVKGEDVAWEITTEGSETFSHIPADIIVKGLHGVKTQLPGVMKLFSVPSDLFRKFITRDPSYAIRQIFRDSTAAWIAGGSDAKPVLSSVAELAKILRGRSEEERELLSRGVGGGQVVTGAPEDMAKILMQIGSGKPGWQKLMAKLDGVAMAGDVATRVTAYKSFLKQGMSQREAALASLEMMNFSRRGISPSIQYLNAMIPFFSANVQGLDVLYRAAAGKMNFEERQSIQAKLLKRGAMVAILSTLYAIAMDDDETYEKATPEQRYSNWFVPLPGVDGMFRVPIPFELGYVFKALPEALVRAAKSDDTGGEIIKDMAKMLGRSVPGDIPLTLKPAIEVMANYSFFSQAPILSERMQKLDPQLQIGTKTPNLLAMLGAVGISPVKAEALFRGYTGSMGISLLGMFNPVFPDARGKANVAQPTMQATDFPLFGRMIQPTDGNNLINKAYDAVDDAQRVRSSFKEFVRQGMPEEAKSYLKANLENLVTNTYAGVYTRSMGQFSQLERMIRMSDKMSSDEKRAKLDTIRNAKQKMSEHMAALKKAGRELQASRS